MPSEAIFKDGKTKQLAKEAIELRYQLLPYNYTLAFENHIHGTPLMRPIFMEDSSAHWSDSLATEYMWGSCFLVKPITVKDNRQIDSFPIYLVKAPCGTWYNFHTGELMKPSKPSRLTFVPDSELKKTGQLCTEGMQTFFSFSGLESIPVLVKGGSFIPMSPIIQSTEAYSDSLVTIHYYDGPELTESSGMWYEDDGLTNEAYEKGLFKLLQMNMSQNAKKTKLTFQPTYGSNMSQHTFTYDVMIHSSRIPKSISVNGKKINVEVIDQKIKLPMALKEKVQNIQINW